MQKKKEKSLRFQHDSMILRFIFVCEYQHKNILILSFSSLTVTTPDSDVKKDLSDEVMKEMREAYS